MATIDAGDEPVTVETVVMATITVTVGADTSSADPVLDTSTASVESTSASATATIIPSSTSSDETSTSTSELATPTTSSTTTAQTSTRTTPIASVAAPSSTTTSLPLPTSSAIVDSSSTPTLNPLATTSPTITSTPSQFSLASLLGSAATTLLPEVIAPADSPTDSSSISSASTTVPAAAATTTAGLAANSDSHKQAVVGGIAGAVGGSFFLAIFVLLCFYDRRRRHQGDRSITAAQLFGTPRPAAPTAQSSYAPTPYLFNPKRGSAKSFKTADGTLIQVDTHHFPRPFADKASWRELAGVGRLHVMNPDRSQPATPNIGTDRMTGFLSGKKDGPSTVTTTEVPEHQYTPRPSPAVHHTQSVYSSSAPSPPDIRTGAPVIEALPPMQQRTDKDMFYRAAYRKPSEAPPLTVQQGTPRQMSTTIGSAFSGAGGRFSNSDYSTDSSRRESNVTDPFELDSPYVSQGARFVMQRPPRAARSSLPKTYEDR